MAKIRGAKELRAAIKRAGPDLRAEATKEVRESTRRMHRKVMELFNSSAIYAAFWHGGAGMQNISGNARRAYRYSIADRGMKGRVGLLSGAAEANAFYLRFFLSGTRHQAARPVHDDAFEAERDVYINNQGKALDRVLARMG